MRQVAAKIVLLTAGILIGLFAAEFLFWIIAPASPSVRDSTFGWFPRKKFIYSGIKKDFCGKNYLVNASYDQYGFRSWGKSASGKFRVLFLGDSYTGDFNMSDAESYFYEVKNTLNADVFAFGAGGYGTFQEFLVLKEIRDLVRPDVVVLQFCNNDYSNNSFELEARGIVRSQKNFRPYLRNGQVAFRKKNLYRFFYKNSALFRFIDGKLQGVQYRLYKGYSYPAKSQIEKNEILREEEKAVQTTRQILLEMRNLIPSARFFSFNVNSDRGSEWFNLMKDSGFEPIPEVSATVEEREREGLCVRAADGVHWNNTGQIIAGKILAQELKTRLNLTDNKKQIKDLKKR